MQFIASRIQLAHSFPDPDKIQSTPLSYILNSHFNTIIPSTPRSSTCYLSDKFSHQNTVYTSTLPIRATCPAHLIILDFITQNLFCRIQIKQLLILRSFLQPPVPVSLLDPTYSQTFSSLRFSLNWRHQVSHPHNTGEEISNFCTQNSNCHEMFPAVRWMFTQWGFLNQSSSRSKTKRTRCGRSTVIS
jgi:hypothetical protein